MIKKIFGFFQCGLLGMLFFWSQVVAAQDDGSIKPVVYSGLVHIDRTGQDVRFRIFFLQQSKLGQTSPTTAAFGIMYFGDEGTHEYVSLYYDQAIVNQSLGEIMLFRDDDARSRRLPTLRLKFNEDLSMITGSMVSQTESVVGNVRLKSGWDFGEGAFIEEVGGIYDASRCERTDGASLKFEEIEIIPSRLHQEKLAPEGMFGVTNFIGNGLCKRVGHVSCVSFTGGSYNFIQGRLDLHHGASDWLCHRIGADEISCQSPLIKQCSLIRTKKILAPTLLATSNIPTDRFVWKSSSPGSDPQDCSKWEGDFKGVMTHRLGARRQHVEIRLNSFPSGTADGFAKCIVTGSAKMHFANHRGKPSVLNFPIVNIEMNAANQSMILHSDAYTDLALHVAVNQDGVMKGAWFSRLYGYVGELHAQRGESQWPEIGEDHAVFSYEGLYTP